MGKFKIKPMTIEHIEGAFLVEEESFAIHWSIDELYREVVHNDLAIYIVALDEENKVVGYAGMWHVITEGHITNIAVLEDYRGLGIGNLLLESLIQIATEKEMIGLTLEVRVGNSPAQKLYSKFGFKIEGYRKNYYVDTKEDAIIMWKML